MLNTFFMWYTCSLKDLLLESVLLVFFSAHTHQSCDDDNDMICYGDYDADADIIVREIILKDLYSFKILW